MLSSTWPILSISFRFIRWENYSIDEVLLHWCNYGYFGFDQLIGLPNSYLDKISSLNIHAILSHFVLFFRLLMVKSGRSLTVRRWHHLLMPESRGKQPWLLISRTLVWWMRTNAAAPYSSTQMVLMQEIRYAYFFFSWVFPAILFSSYVMYCCPVTNLLYTIVVIHIYVEFLMGWWQLKT